MAPNHTINCSDVDLLSISTGYVEGTFRLLLSFRLNPEQTHRVTNLAITGEQAARLHDDLKRIARYDSMKQEISHSPRLMKCYEAVILEQRPVRLPRRRRSRGE
jgi:hypothetical protein